VIENKKSLYTFKNFTDLTQQESDEVLSGRNDPAVRRWMKSDTVISVENHRLFVDRLKKDTSAHFVRIERDGNFVGVYSLNELTKKSGLGGFWITAYGRERMLPLNVVFQGMDYMFRALDVDYIYGYQREDNQSAIRLNNILGMKASADDDTPKHNMQKIEITKSQWNRAKEHNFALLKLMNRMEMLNGTN
jgi:UDP-4-amino-4,6-dideoxy-N-acetyl-beta-L-altrosamine N-acetyltransferase